MISLPWLRQPFLQKFLKLCKFSHEKITKRKKFKWADQTAIQYYLTNKKFIFFCLMKTHSCRKINFFLSMENGIEYSSVKIRKKENSQFFVVLLLFRFQFLDILLIQKNSFNFSFVFWLKHWWWKNGFIKNLLLVTK